MLRTILIAGSPSADSKTLRLVREVERRLQALSLSTTLLELRSLPAEDLLHARPDAPAVADALAQIADASGVVLATPIYKAAYSGLLKTFLDLMPQHGLRDKVLLPLATGGSHAHVLALDYALRPVLQSMDPAQIVGGLFVHEEALKPSQTGELALGAELSTRLDSVLLGFAAALKHRAYGG